MITNLILRTGANACFPKGEAVSLARQGRCWYVGQMEGAPALPELIVERSVAEQTEKKRRSGYLPGLDGWRALAILGVMMTHDAPWSLGPLTNAAWKGYGGDGVYLFFAISGLLICWRILEEEKTVGRFHIGSFYVRRIFRIQPAAIVYLAAVAGLILLGWIHEYWRFWFGAMFFYQNFQFHALNPHLIEYGLFTGHFWTLAVEEHFYVLLSLLLLAVRRYRVLVFAGLAIAIRVGQKLAISHHHFSLDTSGRRTYWIIQYLLWPALLAIILRREEVMRWSKRFLRPWIVFPLTYVLMVLQSSLGAHHLIWSVKDGILLTGREMILRCFPLWIAAAMLHPRALTTRLLEWAPLRWMGRLSYSIYLWHVLFFHLTASQVTFGPLRVLGTRPEKYIASLLAAVASYYLVEKPFIRMGHRLAPPATPGRKDTMDLPVEAPENTTAAPA